MSNKPEYYQQLINNRHADNIKIKMACKILEIEDDVNKLKDSFEILNTIITTQQSNINTLEEYIVNTKQNVKIAEQNVKIASTYNLTSFNYLWYLSGLALGGLAYLGYDFTTRK